MRICLVGVLLLFATAASAQDPETIARFERTFEEIRQAHYERVGSGTTLTEQARLLYGGYVTLAGLTVDGEDRSTRVLRQVDGRFWAEGRLRGHTLYGRLRLNYQNFDTGDSFTGAGDELVNPLSDRYWYRFDWGADQRAEEGVDPSLDWWVQIGRQYMDWVSGLVLSETLYALRTGAEGRSLRVEGFVGVTPQTSTIDFDGSRPNFTSDTDRLFWGVSVEYLRLPGHRPYVYVVGQDDRNDTMLGGGGTFGYDSTYVAVGSTGQITTGQWLYRAEFIWEFGDSTSDVLGTFPQTVDDIQAWAARFLVAFLPPSLRHRGMRFEVEVLVGSGDDDRGHSSQTAGGNTSGTKDESFNAFGYANTGLALAPELANLISVRFGASALPWRGHRLLGGMRVGVDTFLYAKTDDDAPISVTTTSGEGFVGVGVDLILSWILTSDVTFDLRYGIFVPGSAVPNKDPLHFGYLGVSYGF